MAVLFKFKQTEITTVDTIVNVFTAVATASTETMVLSVDIFNGNAGAAKIKAHNVPQAESADNGNRVGQDVSIPTLESVRPIFFNKVPLESSDKIDIETDKQPVNVRVNYLEIT